MGVWKDGLFGRFTNFPLTQTGQTLRENVAVAWGVPLKTGPLGFYSGATPKSFSKEP